MRNRLCLFFVALLSVSAVSAAIEPSPERSIKNIPTAEESLRRAVSPKFYKSLKISPVRGWVAVRGQLAGTRLTNNRVIHSELGGEYDPLALELAGNLHILGNSNTGTQRTIRNVLVHVLLYDIANGRLAVSFANFDDPTGSQWRYYGGAWMAVQKDDGRWVTIDSHGAPKWEVRGPRTYTLFAIAPEAILPPFRAIGAPRLVTR